MKALKVIVTVLFAIVLGIVWGATYQVGYLKGKTDLDRWMHDNNVWRFEQCE